MCVICHLSSEIQVIQKIPKFGHILGISSACVWKCKEVNKFRTDFTIAAEHIQAQSAISCNTSVSLSKVLLQHFHDSDAPVGTNV